MPPSLKPAAPYAILLLLVVLVYSNTFTASFHFDDLFHIVQNPRIGDWGNYPDLSDPRFVGLLTFSLNHAAGGDSVFGYHLVNTAVHAVNAFLVYGLVLLIRRVPDGRPATQPDRAVALVAALLFAAHPVQTQAVTYIVQRLTSLAALFYLAAVVLYLKWRLSPQDRRLRWGWYAAAVVSALLAMKTKENAFTIPLSLLALEAVFFRPLRFRSLALLLPFFLLTPVIPLSHAEEIVGSGAGFARQSIEIGRLDYFLTQFPVVATYLRLLVFPAGQNLDYDFPVYHSFFDPPVFLSFVFLLALFSAGLLLGIRGAHPEHRRISFGIVWFFLTLSVESSLIPIDDVIFEHRVYLPSVGFILAVTSGAMLIRNRWPGPAFDRAAAGVAVTILAVLSLLTYQRNAVWRNEITLWEDVVSKSPNKSRAHNNLGFAYDQAGETDRAEKEYGIAIELDPSFAKPRFNRGAVYARKGRFEEAIREFRKANELQPGFPDAHNDLGHFYRAAGWLEEAASEYSRAVSLLPGYAEARYNLANTYKDLGLLGDAVREYAELLRLKPDYRGAYNNLGNALLEQGRLPEAIEAYRRELALYPEDEKAHNNLGRAYKAAGQPELAAAAFEQAIALNPEYAVAHYNLANLHVEQKRLAEAIQSYEAALSRDPALWQAHLHLAELHAREGRSAAAADHYRRVLELRPDYEPARRALEHLER